MSWTFRRYSADLRGEWDVFVKESRNATFLFNRGYMDYHADRFRDASLMAYHEGRLRAILPADIAPDGVLRSHGGLTYGGWLLPTAHLDPPMFMEMWDEWLDMCRRDGIREVDYRPVPSIYHKAPSQEDIYALWRSGAMMSECNLSAAVDLRCNPGFNTMRRRHLRKCSLLDPEVVRVADTGSFHAMLAGCLDARHGVAPVHSAGELQMLADRFPDNIQVYIIPRDGIPVAGVCMYITGNVAHCQYIATTDEGRRLNMLTYLFNHLISLYGDTCRYFDFGTSNEDHGRILNGGLIRQKYSFGASGVAYPRFTITL